MINNFEMLDLFSGIGGFSYAASQFGIKTVGFCEIDPFCSSILKKHWPDVPNHGDIKQLNFTEHVDLITGGFPCQPFSVAGKMKGKNDDRHLWPEFYRIIKQSKPTWIIAENVAGIVAMELDNIIDDLESGNYAAQAFIIPACAAAAPHRRDRLWIVANRISERCNLRQSVWQERYLQDNIIRNLASLQSEWEKFKPESWSSFDVKNWLSDVTDPNSISRHQREKDLPPSAERSKRANHFTTDRIDNTEFNRETSQPPIPGVDDGLPNIVDRNKALGNSIVPQIAFVLIGLILKIETLIKS